MFEMVQMQPLVAIQLTTLSTDEYILNLNKFHHIFKLRQREEKRYFAFFSISFANNWNSSAAKSFITCFFPFLVSFTHWTHFHWNWGVKKRWASDWMPKWNLAEICLLFLVLLLLLLLCQKFHEHYWRYMLVQIITRKQLDCSFFYPATAAIAALIMSVFFVHAAASHPSLPTLFSTFLFSCTATLPWCVSKNDSPLPPEFRQKCHSTVYLVISNGMLIKSTFLSRSHYYLQCFN